MKFVKGKAATFLQVHLLNPRIRRRAGEPGSRVALGDLSMVDEFFAPDIVCHMPGNPEPIRGTAAFKQELASLIAGFDDIHDIPEFIFAEGDMVVIRETARAKHTRVFRGIPPTGE